jgi:trans-2-enoyl-CoA reductase
LFNGAVYYLRRKVNMGSSEEWDPSKPLDDKELEEEVQQKARAKARLEHLTQEQLDKLKKGQSTAKKRSILGNL